MFKIKNIIKIYYSFEKKNVENIIEKLIINKN